jgi:steroid delta-isomerase-like uncharacterized protein
MSTESNKEILARGIEALNSGDLQTWFGLHDPSVVARGVVPDPTDYEGVKQFYSALRGAFPDFHDLLEDMVAEDDRVAIRFTLEGTHHGELFGVPATGKSVSVSGQGIYRLRDGKIVERWSNVDVLGLMQQLGAIPEPAASS